MFTIGIVSWVDIPAAKVSACCSAIPTSKNRSGNAFMALIIPHEEGMAGVMPTILGLDSANDITMSP